MDVSNSLFFAVQHGNLKLTQELLTLYGLSHSPTWSEGYALLQTALSCKQRAIAKLLVSSGAKINSTNMHSCMPLHIAVKTGLSDIVELLLHRGANVNAENTSETTGGETPLHVASNKGFTQITKILLDHGANINAQMNNGYTALHIAAKNGNEEILKLLLARGAQNDTQDSKGNTALYYAVETESLQTVDVILRFAHTIDMESNRSSFNKAILSKEDNHDIIENLLAYGFSVSPDDVNDSALFHAAIAKGCLKIVEDFLRQGVDINVEDSTTGRANRPLHNAVQHKHKHVVMSLVNHGADVDAKDSTGVPSILYAIRNRDVECTKLLLSNGASINANPDLLFTAVDEGCKEIVEILLERGANINATDELGRTALHFTADSLTRWFGGYIIQSPFETEMKAEIADLLIRKGLDVNAQTTDGITTLHLAIKAGFAKVVKVLLRHNADIGCTGKEDGTALHLSVASFNSEEITKVLLENGADVNARSKRNDKTPLHVAANHGDKQTVKLLLQFGANVEYLDKDGCSALHVACNKENADIIKMLLEYGCDINILDRCNKTPFDNAIKTVEENWEDVNCVYDLEAENVESSVLSSDSDICFTLLRASDIEHHIVVMITANLYVSERNLKHVNNVDYRDFQILCQQELERLKTKTIGNSSVSFHDVLIKEVHQLATLITADNMVKILESKDCEKEYPRYAIIIKSRLRKALRKSLLDQGCSCMQFLLPFNCSEIILSFLCNSDIRNVINAVLNPEEKNMVP